MIQMIKSEPTLIPHLHKEIEDAGLSVSLSPRLSEDDYAAIKVDYYYSDQGLEQMPKAIDFIVSVDCSCDAYVLYLLELKNIKSPAKLNIREVVDKFRNTVNDFLKIRFCDIYLNDRFKYKNIYLRLVSDMYGASQRFSTHEEYKKYRDRFNKAKDSLKADVALAEPLFHIQKKIYQIKYVLPNELVIDKETN